MAEFTDSDDLQGAEFVDTSLRGARFVGSNTMPEIAPVPGV